MLQSAKMYSMMYKYMIDLYSKIYMMLAGGTI